MSKSRPNPFLAGDQQGWATPKRLRQPAESSVQLAVPRVTRSPQVLRSSPAPVTALQRLAGNQAVVQLLTTGTIQRDFRTEAIDRILKYSEDKPDWVDVKTEDTCGPSARHIYASVAGGNVMGQFPAGDGVGVNTLVAAMDEAAKRQPAVFIFLVDGDSFGHFFTILQKGDQVALLQGYLKGFTIAAWLEHAGSGLRGAQEVQQDLAKLMSLRELIVVKDDKDVYLQEFGVVHKRLFGLGDAAKELQWLLIVILKNRDKPLTWKAAYAVGSGEPLPSGAAKKEKEICILM